MANFINFINTAEAQTAGKIIFLLALALIFGSSLLAFFSELTYKPTAKINYPVRSHNITRSTWLWIVLFALIGGTAIYLPRTAHSFQLDNLTITGLTSAGALFFFLFYHFTGKLLKIKFLHAPLALIAAAGALTAAVFWYLPQVYTNWTALKNIPAGNEFFFWVLNQEKIADFIHFILNGTAISALIFMLANAKEKENKRRQPREYYFTASGFAGSYLLAAVTLQIIPLGWIFYNYALTLATPQALFNPPTVYWFAGVTGTAFIGWLLLIKINKDALVNRRATFIITILFIISLSLFHFSPLLTIKHAAADAVATKITPTPSIERKEKQIAPEKIAPKETAGAPVTADQKTKPEPKTQPATQPKTEPAPQPAPKIKPQTAPKQNPENQK